MHPHLLDIVDHLRGLGAELNLIANGSNLTEEVLERLSQSRISIFELPLLSNQRAIHDQLSGAPGAFDRVTEAIVALKERRQYVVVVFVLTRHNVTQLEATLKLAVALGCDGVLLNRFNPGGTGLRHRDELELSPQVLVEAFDCAEAFASRYGIGISCGVPMPPCVFDLGRYRKLTFGGCAAGTAKAYYTVDPMGRLRPCNHSPTLLGDLTRHSLDELLASPMLRQFVAACPTECAPCPHLDDCRGGCKAVAEQQLGRPDVLDQWLLQHRAGHARAAGCG